jgi:hypothetical protein
LEAIRSSASRCTKRKLGGPVAEHSFDDLRQLGGFGEVAVRPPPGDEQGIDSERPMLAENELPGARSLIPR